MTSSASTQELPETRPRPAVSSRSATELADSLAMIEAVAQGKNQTESVSALVSSLSGFFPEANVRCGIGRTRLSRLCDAKLGWLGPASVLFQSMSEIWEDESHTLVRDAADDFRPPASATGRSPGEGDVLRLNIDDANGSGRCIVLLDGPSISEQERRWLRRCLPTLKLLLWDRSQDPMTRLTRWLGAQGLNTRVYLGLAVMILALLLLCPVSYRIRCHALVRPAESRVVATPFSATLAETHVIPGDTVRAGDPIATLDGRPLRLELESINAQIGQVSKEGDIAMAGRRVAERQQAQLKIRELSRQRDLLVDRLERLIVTSPIDGVIVFGDLKRSIGAPLEVGQSIAEVAPLDRMMVEIEIPEHEIGYVRADSTARIRLTASNSGAIQKQIDQLYPSAEVRDNANVFVATIEVENGDGDLRPGMRGTAITYGPIRPWFWSYVRSGAEKVLWWIGY